MREQRERSEQEQARLYRTSGLDLRRTAGSPKHRHSSTLSRRSPARSCGSHSRLHSIYSVTFSPLRLKQTNDLKPPEIGAVFLFCNISTVEASLWAWGPSDSHRRSVCSPGLPRCDAKGVGWKRIAAEMGVGVGTIYRVGGFQDSGKGLFFNPAWPGIFSSESARPGFSYHATPLQAVARVLLSRAWC
jgi:hypothetical protein